MRTNEPKVTCLFPFGSGGSQCSEPPIRSHTVTRGRELKPISEKNHVLGVNADSSALLQGGNQRFRPIGIREASTFPGFCRLHDSELFKPIDDEDWLASEQQEFLLGYRTLCKELHARRLVIQSILPTTRAHGHPENLDAIDEFAAGADNAMRNLIRTKTLADIELTENTFGCFSQVFNLGKKLPFRVSGTFHPESDFNGKKCYDLGSPTEDYAFLCVTNHSIQDDDVIVVFNWFEESKMIGQFVNSFKAIPEENRPAAFFQFCIEHFENLYLQPSWWNCLSQSTQEEITNRFNSSLSPLYCHQPGCLIPDKFFQSIFKESIKAP